MGFRISEAGIQKRQKLVDLYIKGLADKVRDKAERLTVEFQLVRSGEFASRWYVIRSPQFRHGWLVGNNDHEAWFFEKGVRPHGDHPGIPAYHILERATSEWRYRG